MRTQPERHRTKWLPAACLCATASACFDPEEPAGASGDEMIGLADSGGRDDCSFTIENGLSLQGASFDIWLVFVSPETADEWGADLLGDDILFPGQSLAVHGVPLGEYDIRAVDEDADTYTRWGVECAGDDWFWRVEIDDID